MTLAGDLIIDLSAIAENWRALDRLSAPEVETAAVVKADAYGCGAARVGPALARAGARTFFVAVPAEGAALRAAVGEGPVIYILGGHPTGPGPEADLYREHDLRPVLNSAAQATAWFRDSPGNACAIQLDTGMNRLGMEAEEFVALGPLPDSVRLVMSHLACADEPGHPLTPAQRDEFARLTANLDRHLSLAATGGILLASEYHHQMTRAGVGLYGGLPFQGARRVVTLHLPVIQVREVAPGETVGYGATWTATRPSRIATLSGGYADGLIRAIGNRTTGAVALGFIDGRPLPFAGRVSMDLITLDITDCPDVAPGAMVEIIGPNQSVDDLAGAAGTIGYEILTALGSRYARRYTGG